MGSIKVLFLIVSIAVCLEYINAAPKPQPLQALQEHQDLVQKFAEFLHEDAEFSKVLQEVEQDDAAHSLRNKRQADRGVNSEEIDNNTPQEKPGFFDRAAKFVTELLQRFLKWINSEEN